MKNILPVVMVVLSMLGIADAGYITWEKINGVVPPCTAMFKCDEVLSSSWAAIGPVPLSVFGVVFYATFFLVAVSLVLGATQIRIGEFSFAMRTIAMLLAIAGALFSAYLVFIMGVILQAWCLYCLVSAINCVVLLVVTSWYYKISGGRSL